jgi:hypothetical protein
MEKMEQKFSIHDQMFSGILSPRCDHFFKIFGSQPGLFRKNAAGPELSIPVLRIGSGIRGLTPPYSRERGIPPLPTVNNSS